MAKDGERVNRNDGTSCDDLGGLLWLLANGSEGLRIEVMAEGVGFEPTIRFPVYTLSKRAPSATRPSLRTREAQYSEASPTHNLRQIQAK
jgi:hypothetical protein